MLSTQNLSSFPNRVALKKICKAISVMDAILSPEWEFRYYTYDCKWGEGEEFFGMSDGSGNELLILFREDGCVINGFNHELFQQEKENLAAGLPEIFKEFIYGEPVSSIGTTFCLWTTGDSGWVTGKIEDEEDGSTEMLEIFDGNPQIYVDFATDYYEGGYVETGIPLETVKKIYAGEKLTKEMVLSVVEFVEWKDLKEDMAEIDYPYEFK